MEIQDIVNMVRKGLDDASMGMNADQKHELVVRMAQELAVLQQRLVLDSYERDIEVGLDLANLAYSPVEPSQ